jgi:endonuclease/exonuclease/phosphatase family metal-dependent hydrolase
MKLLTYNLLEGGLAAEGSPDRLASALRVIASAEADVVAVLEARHWRRNRREAFRRAGSALGMRGILAPANSGFDIAVFSRLPVLGWVNHGQDTVFLHTTVSVDISTAAGDVVTLFATHLRPEPSGRWQEARLLLNWVRPYRKRLCAICGDFNAIAPGDPMARQLIWPGSELGRREPRVIEAMQRSGWIDCFRTRRPRAFGYTLGARRRVARVDYIFASKRLAARLTGCAVVAHPDVLTASDHSPVWAQFEL